MSCTYTYTSDGKLRCLENTGYDIGIVVIDLDNNDVMIEKSFINTQGSNGSGFKEIFRLPDPMSDKRKSVRLSIVDSTNYNDVNKKTLQLYIEDKGDAFSKPSLLNFSNKVPLTNYYNRTANLEIYNYRGVVFYIK